MKISSLLETITVSSSPAGIQSQQAPVFGRDPKVLETIVAGNVGGGAPTNMGMQTRSNKGGNLLKGIKTSKKYANSEKAGIKEDALSEDDISEEQLLDKHIRQELFNKAKARDIGNRPEDRDIMAREQFDGGGEYNDEVDMVQNNLHTIVRVSTHLGKELQADENLPEWVQEKIAVCKSMIVTVMDYMISQHERGNIYTVDEASGDKYFTPGGGASFGRGRREDDEYHVPDPVDPNTISYNVKVNGQVINTEPLLGRSAALRYAKSKVDAGEIDPKATTIAPASKMTESEHAHYKNYSTSDLLRMIKTIKRDEIGLKIITAITKEIMRRRQGLAEELKMKHQRDTYGPQDGRGNTKNRRPDTSTSLTQRSISQAEVPNVPKTADGHPTIKGRFSGPTGNADKIATSVNTRVEPTITSKSVPRLDSNKPIPKFLKAKPSDEEQLDEKWSEKYKSSIDCSHPKGFSQKAHCAGKKKHNESIEMQIMEMVCEDCGMCKTHGDHSKDNLDEACWDGYRRKPGTTEYSKGSCEKISEQDIEENLHKWFKEKWVRFGPDGKIRGDCARGSESEGKPKCLPQAKAHSLGKKGRASAAARKRREDPNADRSGKAINVSTKGK